MTSHMTAPTTDHGAPATTITMTASEQRQRSRIRVRTVLDAGWPHVRLTIPTVTGHIDLTFGLDEARQLAAATQSAVEGLAPAYEAVGA